jgi:hypothetical protein
MISDAVKAPLVFANISNKSYFLESVNRNWEISTKKPNKKDIKNTFKIVFKAIPFWLLVLKYKTQRTKKTKWKIK